MIKHNKYTILGFKALQRAAAKVAENARKNNYKIPVWENGRIKYEIPDIITEQASVPDPKSRDT
ncbi:MAG: hypothetical protein JRF62_08570 [Deltaproteobacteria bacterium]|nr:hypothetical protein [Deltaproteobacteria bacterium]MBW2638770.1 hypothetical protein [Deltaproteobacteria bacterium]MBW2680420.1 hypothetical protein [Deltaproteobacteria bacterium]